MGKGFEGLEVWQMARKLTRDVYEITSAFPDQERFGLTSQMRRASVSIMSNIAEGWGRHSEASFANFLDMAQGSLAELQSQFYVSLDQGYVKQDQFENVIEEISALGAKIYRLIERLRTKVVREEREPYPIP